MNHYRSNPLSTTRTDPATGVDYTFTSMPLTGEVDDLLLKPDLTIREYILRLFWAGASIGNQSDFFTMWEDIYPNLASQMRDILPLFDQLVHQVTIDIENFRKPNIRENVHFFFRKPDYTSSVLGKQPSELFIVETFNEVMRSPAIEFAVFGYYELQNEKPDESSSSGPADVPPGTPDSDVPTADQSKSQARRPKKGGSPKGGPSDNAKSQPESKAAKSQTLFSNSKDQTEIEFGMPKILTDGLTRGIRGINTQIIQQQYDKSGRHDVARKAAVTIKGSKKGTETEITLDKDALGIKTAEQCASQLIKIKDAKVLQCFFALWKQASLQDNSTFVDMPLSTIMSLVLKPSGDNMFNTATRRAFSDILTYLSHMTISVSQIVNKRDRKGKLTPMLEKTSGISVFRMKALYSVKKGYQKLTRDELQDEHFDQTVINRFSGQLLPTNPELFATRANTYMDSLLQMDANKDGKAILVGFTVQTRFNQNQDKERTVEMDRLSLIELCDYEKTDKTNSTEATKQIRKVLDKLVAHGIIGNYSGLTTSNSDKVRISPPACTKLA